MQVGAADGSRQQLSSVKQTTKKINYDESQIINGGSDTA